MGCPLPLRRITPAAWRALVLRPLTIGTLAIPVLVAPTVLPPAIAAAADASDIDTPPDAASGVPVLTMTYVDAPNTTTSTSVAAPTTTTTGPTTTAPTPTTTPTTTPVAPPISAPPVPHDQQDHTMVPAIEMTMPDIAVHTPGTDRTEQEETPAPATPNAPTGPTGTAASATTGARGQSYVIAPGDSFWRIAAARVESSLGRVPTASEVAPYWRDTVALNADRLPVPGNPDLLFPGDEVLLPPL